MIKYYHELTQEEYNKIFKTGITWGELSATYPQPDWCSYPDAVCGEIGCWALVGGCIREVEHCKRCDYCRKQ